MTPRRLALSLSAAVVATSLVGMGGSAVAAYPDKPITLIVPAGTGGGMDVAGRILATALEARLGTRILIVNKPAGGGIGESVATLSGVDPAHVLREGLNRFKGELEQGKHAAKR